MGNLGEKCGECVSREETVILETLQNENNKKKYQSKRPESSTASKMNQYLCSSNSNNTKTTSFKKLNYKITPRQINKSLSPSKLIDNYPECLQNYKQTNTKIIWQKFQNFNSAQNNFKKNNKYISVNNNSKSNKNIFSPNLNCVNFNDNINYIQNSPRKIITTEFSKINNNKEKILVDFDLDKENKLLRETLKLPKYLKKNFENEHFTSSFSCRKRKSKNKFLNKNRNSANMDKKVYILTPEQIEEFGRNWYKKQMEQMYPKDDVIRIEDIDEEETLKIQKYYYMKKKSCNDSRRRKKFNNCKTIKLWSNTGKGLIMNIPDKN